MESRNLEWRTSDGL